MDQQEYLTLKDLAKRCHLDLTIIREYEEFGLFPENGPAEPDRYLASEVRHLEMLHRLHHELIPQRGYAFNGQHHEIYLTDPRRTAPEKLRTILRQPVNPA